MRPPANAGHFFSQEKGQNARRGLVSVTSGDSSFLSIDHFTAFSCVLPTEKTFFFFLKGTFMTFRGPVTC